jgi:hypothetical protein
MPILIIWVFFGVAAVIVAAQKNRRGCAWFALGFLLGPFGLLFALLLPALPADATVSDNLPASPPAPREIDLSAETKTCPFCAETIKLAARKCRFCGELFSEDQAERSFRKSRQA